MPPGDANDDFDEALDVGEGSDDDRDSDASTGLLARAKRLRDGPMWLGLAPLVILGAAVLASVLGSVALTLTVLFVGAAIWGAMVWRFTRDR